MKRISRRAVIAGGAVAAIGAGLALRPRDRGEGGHSPYFARLSAALRRAGIAQPTMVVDRHRVEVNIATVRNALSSTPLALRVVTKSLQAPDLLSLVLKGCTTDRLMVFNGVMLDEMVRRYPTCDVLLGRPLPAAQFGEFMRRHAGNSAPAAHPQWLIDSPERFKQYAAIARSIGAPLRINLEIDVGLHRGGLPDAASVSEMVDLVKSEKACTVTGLMGYDPQVVAVPFQTSELARVKQRYADARAALLSRLGADPRKLTLNVAGSVTYMLHLDDTIANEVAIGSGFVKPMNFEVDTLTKHVPAAFIAEPVLKALDQAQIPTIEGLAPLLNAWDPNSRRAFFAYGGYGDAEPVSPPGLEFSPLYGSREMLTGSSHVKLKQDDFIFFRPLESEGSFLQFGDIAVYDGADIVTRWPTFPVAA